MFWDIWSNGDYFCHQQQEVAELKVTPSPCLKIRNSMQLSLASRLQVHRVLQETDEEIPARQAWSASHDEVEGSILTSASPGIESRIMIQNYQQVDKLCV